MAMYIHEKHKLIYLASPKTASVATKQALIHQAGFVFHNQPFASHHAGPKGISLGRMAEYEIDGIEEYSVATTIRNHWDTAVSWWFYNHQNVPFGKSFIEQGLWKNNSVYFPVENEWWAVHGNADTILRYERLEMDLNKWLTAHSVSPVKLALDNETQQRRGLPYQFVMDQETNKYITNRFGDEIGKYGYSYEKLPYGRLAVTYET